MLVTLIIGALSGGLAYTIVHGRRGILWSSGGYLIGLVLGFSATVVWAIAVESGTHQQSNTICLGLVGSLLGPASAILLARRKRASALLSEKAEVKADSGTRLDEEAIRSGLRRCPFCAEFVRPEAIVCKHCGRDIEPESRPAPDMPQDTSPQQSSSDQRGRLAAESPPRVKRTSGYFTPIAVSLIGIVAALLYYGLHDRFFLPECDSARAKRTLADVLINYAPIRYEPITTISRDERQVVCNAVLPLPDGSNVVIDYSFYWQGSQANIQYEVRRQR